MSGGAILLGDIGGTNARFVLLHDGAHENAATLKVGAHATATKAIAEYLNGLPQSPTLSGAALACAGPVNDGTVAMTNSPWRLCAREIERDFGLPRVELVNDFAAQAWAVPRLSHEDLRALGGGHARDDAPCVVLGPGTGLGIATYLPPPLTRSGGPAVIVGEGGHVTMPANTEQEAAVLLVLRGRFGHVSAERVLSGEGLVHLYDALATLERTAAPSRTAAEITEAARSGACATSRATLDLFCTMLGGLAGNLALTLGAHGGVYIAGGIAPRIADDLAASRFRESFEAKGRFKSYLAEIPTSVVLHPTPAFLGLAQLWAERERTL